jgi:hypothetical protein
LILLIMFSQRMFVHYLMATLRAPLYFG